MIDFLQKLYEEYLTEQVTQVDENGVLLKQRYRVREPQTWKRVIGDYPGATLDFSDKKVWFSSDHHYGHKNIINFSSRPFRDTYEMRDSLVSLHNEVVHPNDVCIFVGDFAFLPDREANNILRLLHGYKILIIGNHDLYKKNVKNLVFDEMYSCAHMSVGQLDFMITHYPMTNIPDWCFNIHGHEHASGLWTNTPSHFNVNCELHEYRPITVDDIVGKATIRTNAQ